MSDGPVKRRPADRNRIDTNEEGEVQYWTDKFGVTRDKLIDTVGKVGNSSKAVAHELSKVD